MNARNARMIRECSVSERALFASIAVSAIVVVIAAAMPAANAPVQLASSPIDARAAAPILVARMPAPDAQASDSNVVDLTY